MSAKDEDFRKIDAFLDRKLETYKSFSYLELSQLPKYTDIDVTDDVDGFSVGLYREKLKNGNLMIVVQGFKNRRKAFLKIFSANTLRAKGFLIQLDGVIGEVPQKDMWEYL